MTRLVLVTLHRGTYDTATTYTAPERMREQLRRDASVAELDGEVMATYDVVRARSQAVTTVLDRYPDAGHVLWWDDDVMPRSLDTVRGLLDTGHDVVGCPVPRKAPGPPSYAIRPLPGVEAGPCFEVEALGFGLMLTSTRCLRAMVEHYRGELGYIGRGGTRAVALFQLAMVPGEGGRRLLSEDYSFCYRWRSLGGHVWAMPAGVQHIGGAVYG